MRARFKLIGFGLILVLVSRPVAGADVKDLYFGEALYHALQGRFFDALQRLDTELAINVELKGGQYLFQARRPKRSRK